MANPFIIMATWGFAAVIILGLGLPVSRVARLRGPTAIRSALWAGLAVLAAVVTLVNLWEPLRGWPALRIVLVLAAVGAAVGLVPWRSSRTRLTHGWRRVGPATWLLSAFAMVVLAVGSSLSPTHYDFGLYHFSMVRLAADYPAIPGAANLLSYLGYANTEFPLAAFLTNPPGGPDGFRALNGLFALVLLIDLLLRLASRRQGPGATIASINVLVVLGPLLVFADLLVASPTSDSSVFILTVAATAGLADVVDRGRPAPSALICALLPLTVATSMRPQSAIVLAGFLAVIAAFAARFGLSRTARRAAAAIGIVAVTLGVAVLARDYRLSGWAVYPTSLWRFDVPWAAADPAPLRDATVGLARDPSPSYASAARGMHWVPDWLLRQPLQWEFWISVAFVLAFAVLVVRARRTGCRLRTRRLLLLVTPSLAYLVVWFAVLPPTWRLAWGAAFGTGAAAVGWVLHAMRVDAHSLARSLLAVLAVAAILSASLRYPVKPRSLPDAPVRTVTLPSGLVVQVPTESDQCWDNALLCTPQPKSSLRLLGQRIADGFASGR